MNAERAAESSASRRVGRQARSRITDVAARAGVSIKTVSRVANGEPGVRDETRERVLAAINELGFVPNSTARSLKTGGHDVIGVVIDSISDPFFASLVSVIEDLTLARDMSVVFASTGFDATRERDQLQRLAGHQLCGLIVAPVAVTAEELQVYRRRFPVVAADRAREGIDSVVVDDFGAAREVTQQFIALGHRRIAFIGEEAAYPTNSARLAGFRAALGEAGISVDDSLIVQHEHDRASMAAASAQLLQRADAPTAVLSATSRASIATIDAMRAGGVEGIAFISFGDFETADVLTPGVTCVDQDPHLIGTAAFRRLLELIDDPESEPQHIVVDTTLIQRGSGEIRPRESVIDEHMGVAS
ncbi:MAG: LacI family DNA-binding transcriptional regulator [Microcella pacifica]|uniref:LacI family DNA-binding transcriptional regulator n=1 Tax=Microcella pacifica TaxID=2591847 RepID=UPI003315A40A